MRVFKSIFIVILITIVNLTSGQVQKYSYVPPLAGKILLSGNFGEIRPGHIHSGLDMKTGGVTGKEVFAVEEGYVSRIALSETGYGKALYIDHPKLGTTSVYAHLESFNATIDKYITDVQYRKKSSTVDVYLEKGEIAVKQGDIIARSGNSGSSGGPHLHFEIRDQATQEPMNILGNNFITGITDNIAPSLYNLYVVSVRDENGIYIQNVESKYPLKRDEAGIFVPNITKIKVPEKFYFALEYTDMKNGAANTMGVYSIEEKVDGRQVFGYYMDRFAFSVTRYINSAIYYPLHSESSYDVFRCFVCANNQLPNYKGVSNRGVISLTDTLAHRVDFKIIDDSGNTSLLSFDMVASPKKTVSKAMVSEGLPAEWDKEFSYLYEGLSITIPSGALYESTFIKIGKDARQKGALSPTYVINEGPTLLQKYMNVSIKPDSIPARLLEDKLCIASLGKSGGAIYEGGEYKNGYVTAGTRSFGRYFVTTDTISPVIRPSFVKGADLRGKSSFTVTMSDNFSGVGSWSVTVDGKWTLCEYDAKSNTLTHLFKNARYEKGIAHEAIFKAKDNRGNSTTVTTTFTY